ncbi:MAG: hypothetical protein ACE5G8_16180, partial [Anaerolineae bacterium]
MTPLTYFTIAWMLGIALAKWLSPPSLLLFFLAVPAIGGLLLFRDKAHIRFGAINVIALLLGAARLLSVQPAITPGHIAYYNDTDYLLLTAQIIDEPDIRDTYTKLRVQAQ